MSGEHLSDKLVVILHADVAGSTILVRQNEQLAHERIQDTFRHFSEIISKYRGRVHELRGDALLAEFERASDAVSAALAFQVTQREYNAKIDDNIRPGVRVGIALGEVIIADGTITGAGVVLAQRLEQIAEPGGVVLQGAAHETIPERFPFEYTALGDHRVKGFDESIRAYGAILSEGKTIPPPQGISRQEVSKKSTNQLVGIAAILLIAALAVTFWFEPWETQTEAVSVERMALQQSDKPSIAVLPFTNMSGDKEQEYFSDGMTEDLITDLSKISGLTVIARNSSFAYKGKSPDIRNVARDLRVLYVLEGSVRRAGDQVRVNAQLINANTGAHMWADRYDGELTDVFALQDEVTAKIVSVLAVHLTAGEQEQITRRETESSEAYDTFLKGWEQYQLQRPESFGKAIELFENAAELDPKYARAYAALSATYWQVWKRYWHNKVGIFNPHFARVKAEDYLAKAMQSPTPLSHQVSAAMLAQQGRHDEAIAEGERAIALDPNDAEGFVTLASVFTLAGQPEKALPLIERAVRLNPHYPVSYLYEMGLAHFSMNDFERAAVVLEKAVAINSEDRWSSRMLIATLGHLGRTRDAEALIQSTENNWRGFDPLSVRGVAFWYQFKKSVDAERLAEGLRKAGVPD